MTQVSKRYLQPRVSKRIYELFLKSLSRSKNKNELVEFLDDFLTNTEKVMLSKRISVAFLLAKGYDYRQISGVLKVSNATVCSVAAKYKYGTGYKKQIGKIVNTEELKMFLLGAGEAVSRIGYVGAAKGTPWRALNKALRDKKKETPF